MGKSGLRRTGLVAVAALGMGLAAGQPAKAAVLITAAESGGEVVFSASGTIDLTGLTLAAGLGHGVNIVPATGQFYLGATGPGWGYSGFSGPTSFGPGGAALASNYSGDQIGVVSSNNWLALSSSYTSGAFLSSITTFHGSFTSLGLTAGDYTWHWGAGAHADSLTLKIEDAPAPAPVPGAGLLSLAFFALVAARSRAARLVKAAFGRG